MIDALVAMRLADMSATHPAQDESRVCAECGERVGIYPSGQKAIKANPGMMIICAPCALDGRLEGDEARPAGPFEDILREIRESRPIGRA